MCADSETLPPPNEPAAFESLCLDLWKDIWGDPGAQKNGRSGQPQAGVDVFGRNQGRWVGVQCKKREGVLRTKVTVKELEEEVNAAKRFEPSLDSFILATSGVADQRVQRRARELTAEHERQRLFEVQVWSWEKIWHELHGRGVLLRRIQPVYWPHIGLKPNSPNTHPGADKPSEASTTLFWDQQEGRRRGLLCALICLLMLAGMIVWREVLPPPQIDIGQLGHLRHSTSWISYDPSGKKLDGRWQPVYPNIKSIELDLDVIKAAGFGGILTSSSDGMMAQVPRLAKKRGLNVIMGVWNAADRWELSGAIREREYVDAYCVGNNGILERYSVGQLQRALFLIKKRTGRPAITSELASRYTDRLARMGDWLFPDAHLTLKDNEKDLVARIDLDRDIDLIMRITKQMAAWARETERPLVFKNIVYPYEGVKDGSRTAQAEFFRRLLERLHDPQRGHSVRVSIVPQGAFDAPWKFRKPFLVWDQFTGLILFY